MLEQICEVIADTLSCDVDSLTEATNLSDDLGMDSVDAVELNMALEDKFDIKISDEELAELKTIGDIIEVVNTKVG